MSALTVGSLFSGIGGLELGLERAGMTVKWQVEIDDYCTRVLAKHWPNVPKFRDVRTVGAHNLEPVDLICGGFPCQDISAAGTGRGIEGERSGLWREFARVVGELRPRYVIVENVSALRGRGLWRVLADLAEVGYDAEWGTLPAAVFGAPHLRERLFIVAYSNGDGWSSSQIQPRIFKTPIGAESGSGFSTWQQRGKPCRASGGRVRLLPNAGDFRVPYGLPDGVDRLRALGNAVVPQVAEWIGRRIMEADTA